MGLELRHRHVQPVSERQCSEQTVELAGAVRSIEADGRGSVAEQRPSPERREVSFLCERRGGDRFGLLALLDLDPGSVRRDLELELDQELHVLHPALPAP